MTRFAFSHRWARRSRRPDSTTAATPLGNDRWIRLGSSWRDCRSWIRHRCSPFLEEEVLYRQQALRDFKAWDWARRLAKAGVQRVEFDREVSREDLSEFLLEVHRKISAGADDSSDIRYLRKQNIRYGMVSIRGAPADIAVEIAESTSVPYTLDDEIETISWIHAEVQETDTLPLRRRTRWCGLSLWPCTARVGC